MVALADLNAFLADKSYIEGYAPSQADVSVYKSLSEAPSAQYPHAKRWYSHISSYSSEHSSLSGSSKSADELIPKSAASSAPAAAAAGGDDDDDVDLFGSDDEEEDAEAERLKAERLKAYQDKKAAKGPKPAAKSVVTFEVKPWDDETDMKELEAAVRSIEMDGLVWGLSKLVPVGYGVSKLQITLVIEDDKVSLQDLEDRCVEFEDYVQSADVAAMQKL